jgi:predicted HTH transcriptional regulator
MTPKELRRLIGHGESEQLELKAEVPHPQLISRYLASFANTRGGQIVFGVQEPIKLVGVDTARAQRAIDFALSKVDPKPDVAIETVVVDGHTLVVVSVQKSVALVSAYGGYYRRVGDSTQPLSADEIRAHALSAGTIEKALSDLSALAETQTQTIDRLREEFASANSLPKKLGIAAVGAVLGALAKYVVDVLPY